MQSFDNDCIGFPCLAESVHYLFWTVELLPAQVILQALLAVKMLA